MGEGDQGQQNNEGQQGANAGDQGQQGGQGNQNSGAGDQGQGQQGNQGQNSLIAGKVTGKSADGQQGDQGSGDQGQQADAPGKLVFKDRPAWLPENFHDAKTGEVKIEALAKSQSDLRAALAKGQNKAPAKADDYKLEFAPEVADSVKRLFVDGDPAKDPMMKQVREAAHKHGLSQAQFQSFLGDVLPMLESNQPPAFDAAAEMKALDPDPKKAEQIVGFVVAKGQQLRDMGVLTNDMAAEYEIMCGTATGLKTMLALFEYMGEQPIDIALNRENANSATQGQLDQEMAALMKQPDTPAREVAFQALQKKFEALYGNAPSGRSAVRG